MLKSFETLLVVVVAVPKWKGRPPVVTVSLMERGVRRRVMVSATQSRAANSIIALMIAATGLAFTQM
jgi:hypothetical protein